MSQAGSSDISRRKLIEKALFAIPTNELRALIPDPAVLGSGSGLPRPTFADEVASRYVDRNETARLVPCRLTFSELVIEKSKERAFVKEFLDQLKVALPGISEEPLAATVLSRDSDDDPAIVQLTLSFSRAEQLKCLLDTPALLSYTPLLKFSKFDSQYWSAKLGPATASAGTPIGLPAGDVIARLDQMEKKYLDIKDKKNIVESYHEIMKRTNPYEARMEMLRQIEDGSTVVPITGDPPPNPRFPWSGVDGVLSPRAKDAPSEKSGYINMIDPDEGAGRGMVRTFPPDATVVVTKNAIDSAIQQLSVDGVQLSAASAEINRRLEEAVENVELTRIAAAGLVSPQVLEQLVIQSTLKREQQRQKDELRVLKAWEQDGVASVERENAMLYMQRLYAMATGDEEALAALDSGDRKILNPSEFRQKKMHAISQASRAVAPSYNSESTNTVGVTMHVVRGSNLPKDSECFVRAKAGASTEVQTGTVSDGNWEEELFFEFEKSSNSSNHLELMLFQYNSFGRDVLLAQAFITLDSIRDTDGQVGVWVLNGVGGESASLSLRFDVESDQREAFTQFGGPGKQTGVKNAAYKTDLQLTQNLLRERNMDYIADQVEMIEEERRRLEAKIGGHVFDPKQVSLTVPLGADYVPSWAENNPKDQQDPEPAAMSGLRQVEKPFPTYEALYKELVGFVQRGHLGTPEGRQLSYDFCYIGQSKLDFAKDPKLLDYLSLMSDVLVEYQADFPVIVTGLSTTCSMFAAVRDDVNNRQRQISLVLFEAATRSLPLVDKDSLLADQVLTALALVLVLPASLQATDAHIDFGLFMWEKVREPVQVEQILQIFGFCRSGFRKSEQLEAILLALERFRFNPISVQRALIAFTAVTPTSSGSAGGEGGAVKIKKQQQQILKKLDEIELIVVAAGMYADNPGIQVAAIDALSAIANGSNSAAERIENIAGPVVFDQSFERNKSNGSVQASVARFILKLADIRLKEFNLPESMTVLFRIACESESIETALVALAAMRACLSSARRDTIYNVAESTAFDFVSKMENRIPADASIARESCISIEAFMAVADVREILIKAGVTSVPLKAISSHSTEYPRLVKQFLSCLHAVVLASTKAAFQFARLDGVQSIMNLALFPTGGASEWRCFAILADACSVEETKKQFSPDDDIDRIIALIEKQGRLGTGDSENALQGIRVIGEIAFNSSFSTLELFSKVNDTVKVCFGGSGQINFAFQPVIWGLLNRKIPQKTQSRFDRLTSPNGKDLTLPLSESLLKEYNIWVTAQGGSQVGANVAKTKSEREESSKGFLESLTDMMAPSVSEETGKKKQR